jgi:hypothetical protein
MPQSSTDKKLSKMIRLITQTNEAICCSRTANTGVCEGEPTEFPPIAVTNFNTAKDFTINTMGGAASPNDALLGYSFPATMDASVTPGGGSSEVVHGWTLYVPECLSGDLVVRLVIEYNAAVDSDGSDTDFVIALTDQTFTSYNVSNPVGAVGTSGNALLGSYSPTSTNQTISGEYTIPAGATELHAVTILQASGTDVVTINDIRIEVVDVDDTGCADTVNLRTLGCLDSKILKELKTISGTEPQLINQGRVSLTNDTWSPTSNMTSYSIRVHNVNTPGTPPTYTDSYGVTTTLYQDEMIIFNLSPGEIMDTTPLVLAQASDIIIITYTEKA